MRRKYFNTLKGFVFVVLSFFVISHVCSFESLAAEQKGLKIAVINMQKVVRKSKAGQKASEALNKKFEALQGELKAKQDSIKAYKDGLDKKLPLMNEEARADAEREYRKMLKDFKQQSDDAQFDMRQAEAEIMEPVLKALEKIVTKIGESGGYAMIFEANMPGLYYFVPDADITDSVVKAYDEETGKSK